MNTTTSPDISYAIAMGWAKPPTPSEDAYKVWHREYTRNRMRKFRQKQKEAKK